ncbi:MAG: hypothetical protein C5B54_06915, partial [Acidobacteria bacterium]
LRFHGNGTNDIDRVKIQIDDPANSNAGPRADVGSADFTIEFWMRASAAENTAAAVACGNNQNWILGNVILDRDRLNQDRKYGLSVAGGKLVFGVSGEGTGDLTICGATNVLDDRWHEVAIERRRSDGQMWIFVDGVVDATQTGPGGDVSYPDNAIATDPNDPFLVIGAEKYDAHPAYSGWIDELQISTILGYTTSSTVIHRTFFADANTASLYHFDDGSGDVITDATGRLNASRSFGGIPAGPEWDTERPPLDGPAGIALQNVASGLPGPTFITNAGDNRLFIVQQTGQIVIFDGTKILATPFLDVSSLVSCCGERGLLSMAFDPNYAVNGYFFIYYTDTNGDITVARYKVSADPDVADSASSQIFLSISHSNFPNHNGGQLQFGPEGDLYLGTGDGGGGGDPLQNGQNIDALLGKILRINVNPGPPYTIPVDNPFVGKAGADEIWAYGVRNPWRFSFDAITHDLILADVGQNDWEEIDFQPAGTPGGQNYGWNKLEGTHCYPPGSVCSSTGITLPVLEYSHDFGCAITGGYRYRGLDFPSLYGIYFYGDFCAGTISGAIQTNANWRSAIFADTDFFITTFGQDKDGKIYVSSQGTGSIYRIVPADPAAPIFSDDFTALNGWNAKNGTWTLDNGTLLGTRERKSDDISPAPPCSVCNFEGDLQLVSGGRIALLTFFKDKRNMVEVVLDADNDKVQLLQRSGGHRVLKQAAAMTIDPGILYHVRVLFDGSRFQVFVGSGAVAPIINVTAAVAPQAGGVGARIKPRKSTPTTGRFDNILEY